MRDNSTPRLRAGFHTWSFQTADTRIVFLGKGPRQQRQSAFEAVVNRPELQLSWPHQVHSTTVAVARTAGPCGKADALTTGDAKVALSVATADCVPIVVAARRHLAVIHAGWRGLAGQIIQTVLEDLARDSGALEAWIGPAIGACCYEVGENVANQVVATSGSAVLIDRQPRPHLNLAAAAEIQLRQGGIERVRTLSVCTRCSPDWLWSYRRDKEKAGRNWTFTWRDPSEAGLAPGRLV